MDVDLPDANFERGKSFSAPVIGLLVIAFLVGGAFAYFAAQSAQQRKLFNLQTADAQGLQETMEPRVAAFEELYTTIEKTDPTKVDFEGAEKLASYEFSLGGSPFPSDKMLLGPAILGPVTDYLADAAILKQMIDEHERMTLKVDKEELEALSEGNEALQNEDFGVLFDYEDVKKRAESDKYMPKYGRLVAITGANEETGAVKAQFLSSGEPVEVPPKQLIRLSKSQMVKADSGNALDRYQRRLQQIRVQAMKMNKYVDGIMLPLNEMADREGAPILEF